MTGNEIALLIITAALAVVIGAAIGDAICDRWFGKRQ